MAVAQGEVILEVNDLRTYIYTRTSVVKAVDGISFSLRQGETLGIVGESGCGKTMTALSLLQLVPKPAGRIVGGEILLHGEDLVQKNEDEMRPAGLVDLLLPLRRHRAYCTLHESSG